VSALTEWAEQHQPDNTIDIPFSPDYASESEINAEGITAGNLNNAFKQKVECRRLCPMRTAKPINNAAAESRGVFCEEV
jgi:hypothetical protein